jgi:hypothetical protein
MIGMPTGTRIWLVAGVTDMRRGMNGLAAIVQEALAHNPFSRPRLRLPRPARRPAQAALVETATACACSPSVSSAAASSGRKPTEVVRCI